MSAVPPGSSVLSGPQADPPSPSSPAPSVRSTRTSPRSHARHSSTPAAPSSPPRRRRPTVSSTGRSLHIPSTSSVAEPPSSREQQPVDHLPSEVQATLFGLNVQPATLNLLASGLLSADATSVSALRLLTRSDAEQLFPTQVGPRLALLSLVASLTSSCPASALAEPTPPLPVAPGPDLAAAYAARGLAGLDSRLIPPASVLDEATRSSAGSPLPHILELPLISFIPDCPSGSSTGSALSALLPFGITSGARESARTSAARSQLRPGSFFTGLLGWGLTALLRSDIPLSAVVGHWGWCARYLDWYGTYSTALYDQQRRSSVAAAVRSGASPNGAELGLADSMLIVDCRAQMDRVLRTRPSQPPRFSPGKGKGSGRSHPYSTTSSPSPSSQSGHPSKPTTPGGDSRPR
ncbi:hypothetical protein FOL47_000797 [Perkinsus chesapeaki]|uniref:Uncharacterized protein n=1 Tax=Perkinsus chesapeaki TaxID=330153 RepID=A0A7J6KUX5_PERCH|nr:hypothetical protein FOL47_000797 [Perkinsus chesapeaki]